MSTIEKQQYITLTMLKERGWSQGLIIKIIGDHDKEARNPKYKNASPMKLYKLDRVETAESHPDFIKHKSRRLKLVESAAKAVETKKGKLIAQIEAMQITVEKHGIEKICKDAKRHWLNWQHEKNNYDADPEMADKSTVERWMVNYIRHNLTDYDERLQLIAGRVGINFAVNRIRERIFDAISQKYPELKHECHRQSQR